MQKLTQTAKTLIEALPYIRQWSGKTFVIKYGGAAMIDPSLKRSVAQDIALLHYVGVNVVLVHGGGPEISQMMKKLGKQPVFVQGQRVTDEETMEIAQMVLVGKVNQDIVSLINAAGARAVGLSGKDADMIVARKMQHPEVDLGWVGEVVSINRHVIDALTEAGYVVVISPLGVGENGETYNINADMVAGDIAVALQAEKLLVLSDVRGIMRNVEAPETLISTLTVAEAERLEAEGIISEGMIPKVESCLRAVKGGVPRAHLLDGRLPHCLLMEVFTNEGVGTMIQ